jgi:hypothetical protein
LLHKGLISSDETCFSDTLRKTEKILNNIFAICLAKMFFVFPWPSLRRPWENENYFASMQPPNVTYKKMKNS